MNHHHFEDVYKEIEFLSIAEKLKTELRHSWLSSNRQESVAEHSWRMALMVMRFAKRLDKPVDIEKCLKLAIIHDLAEAKTGDLPVFALLSAETKNAKHRNELRAMQQFKNLLNDKCGDDMFELWLEYEAQLTQESKFIKALDKLEVFLQHMEAPLSTWEEQEKRMLFQNKWLKQYCDFDPFLQRVSQVIIDKCIEKLLQHNENVELIAKQAKIEETIQAS